MVAQPFAMVAADHDRGRAFGLFEKRCRETTQLPVHRRDLALVGPACILLEERRRRCVRIVRIVIVDPQEKRLCWRLLEKLQDAIGGLFCRALNTLIAEVLVVELETERQSEPARERERGDESGRPVALLAEPFGEERSPIG